MQRLLAGGFADERPSSASSTHSSMSRRGNSSQMADVMQVHGSPQRSPLRGGAALVGSPRGRPISRNNPRSPMSLVSARTATPRRGNTSARSERDRDPVEVVMLEFASAFRDVDSAANLMEIWEKLCPTAPHPNKGHGLDARRVERLLTHMGFPADVAIAKEVISQYDRDGSGKLYLMEVMHNGCPLPSPRHTTATPRFEEEPATGRSSRSTRSERPRSSRSDRPPSARSTRSTFSHGMEDPMPSQRGGGGGDGEGFMLTGRSALPSSRSEAKSTRSKKSSHPTTKPSRGPTAVSGPRIATTNSKKVLSRNNPHQAQLGMYW